MIFGDISTSTSMIRTKKLSQQNNRELHGGAQNFMKNGARGASDICPNCILFVGIRIFRYI